MDLTQLPLVDLLTACLYAEARGEPVKGRIAVCNVILNRVRKGMGNTITDVILAPKQFSWTDPRDPNYEQVAHLLGTDRDSRWSACRTIAEQAIAGGLADNTGDADHYLNVELVKKLRSGTLPKWAADGIAQGKVTVRIGNHTFLNLRG